LGAKVSLVHKKSNLSKDADMVIYSPAVREDNPEILKAKELKISLYSYPEALGLISKDKYTIAVSGAHGKTTTTAMISEIMISAGKKPTVVIGSFLKKQKDNFVLGRSRYFIVEACEYKKSFLNLSPDILVITNIDNDHLDYYKNIRNIQKAFGQMISKVPPDGFIVCAPNDKNIKEAIKFSNLRAKIIDYAGEKIDFKLMIPGEHNVLNAKAAMATVELAGVKKASAEKYLKNFSGVWRRVEYKGKVYPAKRGEKGALIYDDYGHHPTEIRATLKGAREQFPNKKIIVVFQPHLYSRTKLLLNDFSRSFNSADEIIITDIYAAREKDDGSIHAKDLAEKITNAVYLAGFSEIKKRLKKEADKDTVIITLGAGDVYKIGEGIRNK
jgi:UDP-N-acetylmuramate--alanine ligase